MHRGFWTPGNNNSSLRPMARVTVVPTHANFLSSRSLVLIGTLQLSTLAGSSWVTVQMSLQRLAFENDFWRPCSRRRIGHLHGRLHYQSFAKRTRCCFFGPSQTYSKKMLRSQMGHGPNKYVHLTILVTLNDIAKSRLPA
jgi:hypothetical protein